MFVLYAIVAGLIVGLRSRAAEPASVDLKIRWGPLIIGGLLFQVVLFSGPVAERVGDLGPALYVASTARGPRRGPPELAHPGYPDRGRRGASCNLAAILANGGYMPASVAALGGLGKDRPDDYSNSSIVAHPALGPLTDIFAMPHWLPFANVFSIGDVLIAVGVGTRDRRSRCAPASAASRWDRHPRRRGRCAGPTCPHRPLPDRYRWAIRMCRRDVRSVPRTNVLRSKSVQGKPAARRGRKARDLPEDRPAAGRKCTDLQGVTLKANLARFTWAVALVASMALTLGAGMRWDWWD